MLMNLSDTPTHDRDTRRVRPGDTVRVNFEAWLEDGTVIGSSTYGPPFIFTVGQTSVMQGMQEMAIGMSVGESKTEKIPPDRAFGPYRAERSCQVSSSWLRAQHVTPALGLGLEVRTTDDTILQVIITGMNGDNVTVDANHRLAGRSLILQLDLLEIVESAGVGACITPPAQL